MPRFVAIKPAGYDTLGADVAQHPTVVWTWDGVIQIGTRAEWDHIAHDRLIEVPDSTPGAPVERLTADHHEHIVEWWRDGPELCLGVIGNAAVAHTPDDGDHALVVGTAQEWAQADWLWGSVTTVRVPAGTPGMSLDEHRGIVRPTLVDDPA